MMLFFVMLSLWMKDQYSPIEGFDLVSVYNPDTFI